MYGYNCVNVSQCGKQCHLLWPDHFLNIVFILQTAINFNIMLYCGDLVGGGYRVYEDLQTL